MDDPVLTTQEAAQLLGVSVRTAQNWIEADVLDAWKTPGGHRRVRKSAVIQLRDRLAIDTRQDRRSISVLLLADQERAERYRAELRGLAGVDVECCVDTLSTLVAAGRLLPAAVVVEVVAGGWDRGAMVGHLLNEPLLGHARVIALCDAAGRGYLRSLIGHPQLDVLDGDYALALSKAAAHAVAPFMAEATTALRDETSPLEYPVPANEPARLRALDRSGLVQSSYEDRFDDVAAYAAKALNAPICLISLLTRNAQWFKAHHGLDVRETPRAWAFCNYAIIDDFFSVRDAREDPKFLDNPLVVGPPHIRFYAGAALRDVDGYALGSLCVIDRTPRTLDSDGEATLRLLAGLVSDRINVAIRSRQLHWSKAGKSTVE